MRLRDGKNVINFVYESMKMSEKNKVIGLFNDSFPPVLDGVTLTVQNYVRWLTEAGERCCVVTPWNPVAPPAHKDYDLYRFFSLPIPSRKPYRYGYPKLDMMIWRRLRNTTFSIVHAHCPFSAGRLALYAARKQRVPLVATFHSKYRTDLEHSLPEWMVRKIMKRVMDFFNAADEVWIPQAKVEETVREYGYRGRLTVVENGIDSVTVPFPELVARKRQVRREAGISPDEMRLLFVGQHIREKGVELIIRALVLLADLPVKMDFVGTGYYVGAMRSLIARLGLSDRVTLHGVVSDRAELRRLYECADLFLFPSYYDNAPLVVREAAAAGTPAIIPAGSTASEVIIDGGNGFLAEHTPGSYAQTIRRLYTDRQALLKAAEGASATLTRSWQEVIEEVLQRYNEIIARYERH